jgi:hypothetical protein
MSMFCCSLIIRTGMYDEYTTTSYARPASKI